MDSPLNGQSRVSSIFQPIKSIENQRLDLIMSSTTKAKAKAKAPPPLSDQGMYLDVIFEIPLLN